MDAIQDVDVTMTEAAVHGLFGSFSYLASVATATITGEMASAVTTIVLFGSS